MVIVLGSSRVSTPVDLHASTSQPRYTERVVCYAPVFHLYTAYCPPVRGLSPTCGAVGWCAYVPRQARARGSGRGRKLLWGARLALVHRIRRVRAWDKSGVCKSRDVLLVQVIVVCSSTPQFSTSHNSALSTAQLSPASMNCDVDVSGVVTSTLSIRCMVCALSG